MGRASPPRIPKTKDRRCVSMKKIMYKVEYDYGEVACFSDSNTFEDFLNDEYGDVLSDCFEKYKDEEYTPDVPIGYDTVFETAQDYIDSINEVLAMGETGNNDIVRLLQYGIQYGMQDEIVDILTKNVDDIGKYIFQHYITNCYVEEDKDLQAYIDDSYDISISESDSLDKVEEEIRDFIERMEDELDIKVFDLKKEATETIEHIKEEIKNSETYIRLISWDLTKELSSIDSKFNLMDWTDFELTEDGCFRVKADRENFYKEEFGFDEVRKVGDIYESQKGFEDEAKCR